MQVNEVFRMTLFSFFPNKQAGAVAAIAVAGAMLFSHGAQAQDTGAGVGAAVQPVAAQAAPAQGAVTLDSNDTGKKKRKQEDKVVQSKDTKKEIKKDKKTESLAGLDSKLPDKQLYDKAVLAMNKGHFDVARLELQTMLNTYPDSQYQMRAKLAIADSWYKEGGTASLTQAESEYADFRVFFPNAPEAAEAQMRIGDIYFRQMDKPDRDYAKAVHAEEEYRRMLTDYPDSILVPQAKQKLRDVQEVLATRESTIAQYYASHENWAATIARYQTVADTYPYYSHMDDTLIGLGDAYEAQARYVRSLKQLPEGPRAKLEETFDSRAAAMYDKVVLEHSASAHVEDAKDRLVAMGLPVPTPTPEQVAASVAMENSRHTYAISDRLGLFFLHKPDTVTAVRMGEPTLSDPKPTLAPLVSRQIQADFQDALTPTPGKTPLAPVTNTAPAAESAAPVAAPVAAAPLQFNDVPSADAPNGSAPVNMTAPARSGGATSGTGMGVEIVTPEAVIKPVGPPNASALPAVEKPAEAPGAVNDVAGQPQAPAQKPAANGKKGKPELDKDESSSKKKKKKGLDKLNPF
jgi:outer membrane protein assembly factor BamD